MLLLLCLYRLHCDRSYWRNGADRRDWTHRADWANWANRADRANWRCASQSFCNLCAGRGRGWRWYAGYATIAEGLAAVSLGGTVHVLGGLYPITSQLNVNKQGVTLQGYPDTIVQLQAAVVPFLLTANGITMDGFTITSDAPYPVEFIQIAGQYNRLTNNIIYGPPQEGDSSTWVVNRGFVTQGGVSNLLVQGNIFYSLRQPAYLNPGSNGHIIHNVVYNTRGFVVDGAVTVVSELGGNLILQVKDSRVALDRNMATRILV